MTVNYIMRGLWGQFELLFLLFWEHALNCRSPSQRSQTGENYLSRCSKNKRQGGAKKLSVTTYLATKTVKPPWNPCVLMRIVIAHVDVRASTRFWTTLTILERIEGAVTREENKDKGSGLLLRSECWKERNVVQVTWFWASIRTV